MGRTRKLIGSCCEINIIYISWILRLRSVLVLWTILPFLSVFSSLLLLWSHRETRSQSNCVQSSRESSNWKKKMFFVLFLCFDLGASREWVMMFLWCSLKAPARARACGIEFSRSWGTQREAAAKEEEWEKMSDSRSTVKPANNTKNGKISNEVLLSEMAHENSFHFLSIDWLLEQKKEIRRRVMRRVEG